MNQYLLDTNILIAILRNRAPHLRSRLLALPREAIAISIVSYAELLAGIRDFHVEPSDRVKLQSLVSLLTIHNFSFAVAEQYAVVFPFLKRQGLMIGANDLWIAAHALALDATLVTNNEREFRRVPDLKIENWIA